MKPPQSKSQVKHRHKWQFAGSKTGRFRYRVGQIDSYVSKANKFVCDCGEEKLVIPKGISDV